MMGKTRFQRVVALFLVIFTLTFALSGSTLRGTSSRIAVIVRGATLESAVVAVAQNGGRVLESYPMINAVLADIPVAAGNALTAAGGVEGVFPNHAVEVAGNPAGGDVKFAEAVGAADVWAEGHLGQGVTVAFLDTGIEPRFARNLS